MAIIYSDALVFDTSSAAVSGLNRGRIGYKNYVNRANISASTENSDFPAVNVSNVLTAERWKPLLLDGDTWLQMTLSNGARGINYAGIAAHTLGTSGCGLIVEFSSDEGATFTQAGEIVPTNNRSIMINFATQSAAVWRLRIYAADVDATVPSIGVVYFGLSLQLQRGIYGGHSPLTMSRKSNVLRNRTEGGQYAGASLISQGLTGSISVKNLRADWVRKYLDPFILAARTKPFFFAWRPFEYPDEAVFIWAVDDIRPSNMGIRNLMEFSMNVEGFNDE